MMAEPASKRLRGSLPVCGTHGSSSVGSSSSRDPAAPQLTSAVEEALCGVSSLLWAGVYRLQALASVFERDDAALPRVASFLHRENVKQQAEAQAMLHYLAERGGRYCGKDIQRPNCEAIFAVIPALEMLKLQLNEEIGVLVELSQLAHEHKDPVTAGVVKSHFLAPRVDRLKQLGDLLTSAWRVGCTMDQEGGFGEYILNELQEELTK